MLSYNTIRDVSVTYRYCWKMKNMSLNKKRRTIIKVGLAGILVSTTGCVSNSVNNKSLAKLKSDNNSKKLITSSDEYSNYDLDGTEIAIKDNLQKVKNFNQDFSDDIFLSDAKMQIFLSTLNRIQRVQHVIGYANFNLVSFDSMLFYANRFPKIGAFHKNEINFMEEIFLNSARNYGFYGKKVIDEISSSVDKKETVKIARSGHYLFNGDALKKYNQLKKDIGKDIILTSGVRSVVKQLQLFLAKLKTSNGNLSLTSRSLAPPGHSYHGIGDFDVGKKGFGKLNFTAKFASTEEYKKLIKLNYVDLRYTKENNIGVRYEPWHIKVV